jgi:hypothetical protein
MLKKIFAIATLFTAAVFCTQAVVASEAEEEATPKIEFVKGKPDKKAKSRAQQKKTQILKKQQQEKRNKKSKAKK